MLAMIPPSLAGIVTARQVPVAGLARPYRILAVFVALMPVLMLLSVMHARFDTDEYLAERGRLGPVVDTLGVLVLAGSAGGLALAAALAVDAPAAVAIGGVVAYVGALLFFRRRNDPFYLDTDEILPEQEPPDIDDYPEEIQREFREE